MPIFKRDQDPYQATQVENPTTEPNLGMAQPAVKPVSPAVTPVTTGKIEMPGAQAARPVSREAAAVVDKKSEIHGTLHSQGNVLIEGCFQGEIDAKETVWVENGAQTKAQLRANDVVISGAFDGEIVCEHRLQIASTATITGEIKTPVLVIEEGSTVNCRFNMTRSRR